MYFVWNPPPRQPSQFSQYRQHRLSCLAGEFYGGPILCSQYVGLHKKYILNLWSINFNPGKVSLPAFAILFKILSAHCVIWNVNMIFLLNLIWLKQFACVCHIWKPFISNYYWEVVFRTGTYCSISARCTNIMWSEHVSKKKLDFFA